MPAPYEGLAHLLNRSGRVAEAGAVLDQGIAATDRSPRLLNMRAEFDVLHEQFEAAIELYGELYDRDPSNVVIANNLATLLASHRADEASLEQAFKAARRLRGSDNPYYQDTYGWILTRRGDARQALTYLEPAAAALTDDPLTQYHLGVTYFDLQRWDEARAALSRALEIAGPDSDLPQMADVRRRMTEIAAAQANSAPPEGEARE
jgi:predicted Zn-dependent protease